MKLGKKKAPTIKLAKKINTLSTYFVYLMSLSFKASANTNNKNDAGHQRYFISK